MYDKEIILRIISVLDSLIAELSPQMGASYTDKLFAITTEIELLLEEQEREKINEK